MAVFRCDAFRMELHSVDRLGFMLQAHDNSIICFCCNLKAEWQRVTFDNQRMIARNRVGGRQSGKDTSIMMQDRRNLSMHRLRAADHVSAEGFANGLMPKTNTEQRDVMFASGLDQVQTDPRMSRIRRAGRNHNAGRLQFKHIIDRNFIIAIDIAGHAQITEILDEIERETVIIIYQNDIHNMVIPGTSQLGKSFDNP